MSIMKTRSRRKILPFSKPAMRIPSSTTRRPCLPSSARSEHAGYVVEVVRDGQDALRKVEASRPDLMVLGKSWPCGARMSM